MTHKKLTLDDLKVQSFSTDLSSNEKANIAGATLGASQTDCFCDITSRCTAQDCTYTGTVVDCQTESSYHSCAPNFCETEQGCEPYTSIRYPTCDGTATCTPGQNGC